MLRSLLPKAHHKFSSLPLLGPIIDGFDDWLAASGYTPGSREFAIRMLPHVMPICAAAGLVMLRA